MTIAQLEYLLACAQCGSFSAAAERCFITQPSLSIQIKNLEEELGIVLLDRSKKPIVPTPAGSQIIEQARRTLEALENIKKSASDLRGDICGDLRLAFIPTITPYLAHLIVPLFTRKYPQVKLHISEMVTKDIIENLKNGKLDAGILAEGFAPGEIQERLIVKDKFFAFISPDHPLSVMDEIDIRQIDSKDLLLLTEGHCLRKQVLNLCSSLQSNNSTSSLTIDSGSIETLIRITLTMRGITIIPGIAIPYIDKGIKEYLHPISNLDANRNITLATYQKQAKENLLKALEEELILQTNDAGFIRI